MKTLKKINLFLLLILCGIFTNNMAALAQCNVDAGQDQQICDGQTSILTASASGGEPPYNYQWSTGENTQTISVSPSETTTYSVTVTDMESCIISDDVTLEVSTLMLSLDTQPNSATPYCIGTEIEIIATVTGGTAPYFYQWSDAQTTQTLYLTLTTSGTYSLTVTDVNGCQVETSVTFEVENCNDCNVTVDAGQDQQTCIGGMGILTALANDGTPPYAYNWSTGEVTQTISVFPSENATYGVTVTDANSCTVSDDVTVNILAINIALESTVNPTTCNGNDGTIMLSGLYPDVVFTLHFNGNLYNVIADANGFYTIADLAAGTYSDIYVVLDDCVSNTVSATLTEQIAPSINVNEAYCDGNNAIIEITGLFPFTIYTLYYDYNGIIQVPFSISTDASGTIILTNLEAGFYSNFVASDGVCESVADVTVVVQDCSECDVNVALVTQPNSAFPYCIDTAMEVFPNPTNGEMPYTYEWSNGQTTPILSLNLTENITYTLTVTDGNGCMTTESISFEVEDCGECDLMVDLGSDLLICGDESANISSMVSNGTPPYTYEWSEAGMGQSATTAVPNNVSGTYSVTVTDFNGCTATDIIVVIASNLQANIAMEWTEPFCQTDTIVYSAMVFSNNAEPYTYLWTLNGEVISTEQSFTLQVLQENHTVTLEVVDANGCVMTDEKEVVNINCTSIWPGDVNNDGIANNNDVLEIGLAYGTEGVERFEASANWEEQYCTNWETEFENGINHNFGDCDGNGTINEDDVAVVALNYGQVHGKNEGENGDENDIPLFCELPENIISGGSYSLPIKLGNDDIAAADIYGIAFTVSVTMEEDFELLEPQINFNDSWLGTQGFDMISLDKNVNTNQWDIALARTDQTDISGSGKLCSIDCIMEVGSLKNASVLSIPVSVSFSKVTLINAQAVEILTNPITTQAEVVSFIGEIENDLLESSIYPNPATDILYIENANNENLAITIMNVLGQTVAEQNISANENRSTIDVSHLDSGYYLVKIEEQNQQKTYKLWID